MVCDPTRQHLRSAASSIEGIISMELDQFKLERTTTSLKALSVDVALFTEFYNVSYLTGFTLFLENGPHPLSHGLCAALLTPGQVTLISDAPCEPASSGQWMGPCQVYAGYRHQVRSAH